MSFTLHLFGIFRRVKEFQTQLQIGWRIKAWFLCQLFFFQILTTLQRDRQRDRSFFICRYICLSKLCIPLILLISVYAYMYVWVRDENVRFFDQETRVRILLQLISQKSDLLMLQKIRGDPVLSVNHTPQFVNLKLGRRNYPEDVDGFVGTKSQFFLAECVIALEV